MPERGIYGSSILLYTRQACAFLENAALFFFEDEPDYSIRLLKHALAQFPHEAGTKMLLRTFEEMRRAIGLDASADYDYWKGWNRDF